MTRGWVRDVGRRLPTLRSGVPAKICGLSPQSAGHRRHWAPGRRSGPRSGPGRPQAAPPGPDFRSLVLCFRGRCSGKGLRGSLRRGRRGRVPGLPRRSGSLGSPPPAGSPSWAPCPKPVQSRDRPVGIGRPVSPSSRGQWCAAEWPRAPALPARKKLDHPSRQRKRALPCFPRRLRQARARCAVRSGAGWGSPRKRRARARKRLRLSRCLCFFGAARPPGQLAFPLLSARLSSKAFPRQLWGTREMCSRTESRPQSHHPVEAAVFYCISFHFTSFHFVSFRFVSFSSKEAVFSGYCVSLLPRDLDLLLFITQRYISENRCHVSCHFTEKQGRRTASNVAVSLDWKVQ